MGSAAPDAALDATVTDDGGAGGSGGVTPTDMALGFDVFIAHDAEPTGPDASQPLPDAARPTPDEGPPPADARLPRDGAEPNPDAAEPDAALAADAAPPDAEGPDGAPPRADAGGGGLVLGTGRLVWTAGGRAIAEPESSNARFRLRGRLRAPVGGAP